MVGPDWVGLENPANVVGHAYATSNFPTPWQYLHGLLMGSNICMPSTVTINSPADSSFIRASTVKVQRSTTDALSEITYFTVKLDNGKWAQMAGTSYMFSKLKAGPHTVAICAGT